VKTILSEFRGARQQLVELAGAQSPEHLSRALLHPRLRQPMRLVDHLFFVAEHDDHHLARIWELIATTELDAAKSRTTPS
jgi:hypothetical protein